jgi:hypothetical protein
VAGKLHVECASWDRWLPVAVYSHLLLVHGKGPLRSAVSGFPSQLVRELSKMTNPGYFTCAKCQVDLMAAGSQE